MTAAHPYAIIDCETTGFSKVDRVIEIAVVVLDGNTLATVDEFDSLVNPMRDVGPTEIHGITPSMLAAAPSFDEIVAGLAQRLDGAVLVAHNLPFDQRFVEQECERAHAAFDAGSGHCTLRLTGAKLAAAADCFGVTLNDHHRALADARATSEIFRRAFERSPSDSAPARMPMPAHAPASRTLRREAVGAPKSTPLARLLSRACYPSSLEACVAYFEMLDWVLADGVVTADERALLDGRIRELAVSPAQVRGMHEAYYRSILCAVERDRVVSNDERNLLASVARSLDLGDIALPTLTTVAIAPATLAQGTRICFTGAALDAHGTPILREDLERKAASRGLQPVASVTKKSCDLLVASDPASTSGKAQKARDYGIPVMSVVEFLSVLG